MALVREMPVKVAAALLGEHDTRIWRVLDHYVQCARAQENHSEVKRVGIDETSARCQRQSKTDPLYWFFGN